MYSLQTEVKQRFGTIHRFCKQHPELNRSTVYMMFAGTYGGNKERQEDRIRMALNGESDTTRTFQAIKGVACAKCAVRGECSRCDALFEDQAREVQKLFSN